MAEDASTKAAKGSFDFLKQKVGPLPIGIWLAAGVGIWWYMNRQQSASSSASQAANQQTDPAGNIGSIDPATGYVYGTPEDLAALAANNAGTTGTGSAGQGATSGGQTYADNNAWGIAAVNYLVGLGIDATTANQAVELYLNSQPLTTAQQGDVNLAIQALGPPPTLPGPVSGNPPPVTTPGGGGGTGSQVTVPNVVGQSQVSASAAITKAGLKFAGTAETAKKGSVYTVDSQDPKAGTKVNKGSTVTVKASVHSGGSTGSGTGTASGGGITNKKTTAPVPTGLVVAAKHSTSLQVKWNASKGATGYHVLCTDMASKKVTGQSDVPSSQTTATIGGLTPSHSYVVDVWAEPEAGTVGSGPHAEVSATLPKTG